MTPQAWGTCVFISALNPLVHKAKIGYPRKWISLATVPFQCSHVAINGKPTFGGGVKRKKGEGLGFSERQNDTQANTSKRQTWHPVPVMHVFVQPQFRVIALLVAFTALFRCISTIVTQNKSAGYVHQCIIIWYLKLCRRDFAVRGIY